MKYDLKIKNDTVYESRQLRSLVVECIKREELFRNQPECYRKATFHFRYARANTRRLGCAVIDGFDAWINLPRQMEKIDVRQLAHTIIHEMGHLSGLHHKDMNGRLDYDYVEGWRDHYAWADQFMIGIRAQKDKPTDLDKASRKRAQVIDLMNVWQRKAKLASTKIKKYRQRLRYYDNRLAAMRFVRI